MVTVAPAGFDSMATETRSTFDWAGDWTGGWATGAGMVAAGLVVSASGLAALDAPVGERSRATLTPAIAPLIPAAIDSHQCRRRRSLGPEMRGLGRIENVSDPSAAWKWRSISSRRAYLVCMN